MIALKFFAILVGGTAAAMLLFSLLSGSWHRYRLRRLDQAADLTPEWLTPGTYPVPGHRWMFTWTGVGWLGPIFDPGGNPHGDRLLNHPTMVEMYPHDWSAIERAFGPEVRAQGRPYMTPLCPVCLHSEGIHDRYKHDAKGQPLP